MPIATATVKGGFWETNGVPSLLSIDGTNSTRDEVQYSLGRRQLLDQRAIIAALNGVAPGALASKAVTRIVADAELGGKRVVESVNLINRVTTAADVTNITNTLLRRADLITFGPNPPINKDQNPLGTR